MRRLSDISEELVSVGERWWGHLYWIKGGSHGFEVRRFTDPFMQQAYVSLLEEAYCWGHADAMTWDVLVIDAVRAALEAGKAALAEGGAVIIHCSAGIHRTGMFGYALLRVAGLDREAATAKLRELRAVTAEGVGSDRLAWGDRIAEALSAVA